MTNTVIWTTGLTPINCIDIDFIRHVRFIHILLCFFFSMFAHCRDQLNTHLDNVQGDLEALKEFLRSGGGDDYQVDANTLLNVSSFKKIDFVFPYDCLTQTQTHNTHFTHTRLHMHTHTHTNQEKKNNYCTMLHIDLFSKVRNPYEVCSFLLNNPN